MLLDHSHLSDSLPSQIEADRFVERALSTFMPRQSMQPHARGAQTSTNLNSSTDRIEVGGPTMTGKAGTGAKEKVI